MSDKETIKKLTDDLKSEKNNVEFWKEKVMEKDAKIKALEADCITWLESNTRLNEEIVKLKEEKKPINIDLEAIFGPLKYKLGKQSIKPTKLVSINLLAIAHTCGVEDPESMTMVETGKVERSMRHLFEQTKAYGE